MKAGLLAMALLLFLPGCVEPDAATLTPPPPGDIVVHARNNGTAPAWFHLYATEAGTTLHQEQKQALTGQTVSWSLPMKPNTLYRVELDYSATPTFPTGFSFGFDVNSTYCPGTDFVIQGYGRVVTDDTPALSFKTNYGC